MSEKSKTIALLDGSNYETWSVAVKNLLREKTLWVYVNGTIPKPIPSPQITTLSPPSSSTSSTSSTTVTSSQATVVVSPAVTDKDVQKWAIQDDSATGLILGLVSTTIAQEVERTKYKNSLEVWTYLEKTYEHKKNHGSKYATLLKIRRSKFTGGTPVQLREHLNAMIVLNRSLGDIAIGDSVFAFDMMYSLPDESPYASIKDGLISQHPDLEKLTPTIVRDHFADRIELHSHTLSDQVTLAATISRPTCDFCKKPGHVADRCYKKNPHLDPRKRKGSTPTVPTTNYVSVPAVSSSFANQSALVSATPVADPNPVDPHAYFNGRKVWVVISLESPKVQREAIYVDSGCSEHVSPMREYFEDRSFTMLHTPVEITVGDNRTLHATHFGNIALITTLPNGSAGHLLLKNVLYCEQMVATLLSTTSLNR